jgi:hypothetical protein
MQGDYSLNPLTVRRNVSRVLLQQGRVMLDSDWNEQSAALLDWQRNLAADIIGPHGGVDDSFLITVEGANNKNRLSIARGVYYVDGIRCANAPLALFGLPAEKLKQLAQSHTLSFRPQPFWPVEVKETDPHFDPAKKWVVYLDVWERHVSAAQNSDYREIALGGPDTAARAVVVWQVKLLEVTDAFETFSEPYQTLVPKAPAGTKKKPAAEPPDFDVPYIVLNTWLRSGARLAARATENVSTAPCIVSPDARYRGADNRLYRVEIHDEAAGTNPATFKFSRDNGSVAFPVVDVLKTKVTVASLGRDPRTSVEIGDWVEIADDLSALTNKVDALRRVVHVDRAQLVITLDNEPALGIGRNADFNPILRRWETAPINIREGTGSEGWIHLPDGVQVQFSRAPLPHAGFRRGDYWLIPARTATGDVLWPKAADKTQAALPPHGVTHHYAPLALLEGGRIVDLRWTFDHLAVPVPPETT